MNFKQVSWLGARPSAAEAQIVWVLGAGFSRSLGGPLLNDLFSRKALHRLAARYPDVFNDPSAESLFQFCQNGINDTSWQHAEEFLELLDAAKSSEQLAKFLKARAGGITWRGAETSARLAKQLVTLQCSEFLEGITVKDERALPYVNWLKSLGARDTLISYNYDRVVECLGESEVEVLPPDITESRLLDAASSAKHMGKPLLAKLHGSVDWSETENGFVASRSASHEAAILTPGRSKYAGSRSSLELLHRFAHARIEHAHLLVFLGFRLPESDASALQMFTKALRRNESKHLRAVVVLGPGSPDAARLQRLLTYIMSSTRAPIDSPTGADLRYDIDIPPVYAQDFLQVATREVLWSLNAASAGMAGAAK